MQVKRVAILTAGGLAPCLSSAVGALIERYTELAPEVEILCYRYGYKGVLLGDSIRVTPKVRAGASYLHAYGGSPIGNSRVKLTNVKDCLKRNLIKEGQDPQKVAADQLVKDGIDVLHVVGGDDTNTAAADLADFLGKNNYKLTVIGLPKTVDNDVYPIRQSLGAITAAEQGAHFFENVVSEASANPHMLIVHEVMGRHCGWLTVATALAYRKRLLAKNFLPEIGISIKSRDIHGVYIPEMECDMEAEVQRLKRVMDTQQCVNLFISEGANVDYIVAEMKKRGEPVPQDAFGHVKLDAINPGKWFADHITPLIGAEKALVQKSGYFARSAPANAQDRRLIQACVDLAVQCAFSGTPGVIGFDEDKNTLRAIEFGRIKGGKPYALQNSEFVDLLKAIDQPMGKSQHKTQ